MHLREPSDPILQEIRAVTDAKGITIADTIIGEWLDVQYKVWSEARGRHPEDWFVIADQDELQVYPLSLIDTIEDCERHGFDHLKGCFVDRFAADGRLQGPEPGVPLWDQYPIGAFFTFPILGGDPRKIVATKGPIKVTSSGHHTAVGGVACPVERCLVEVHHFKWVEGVIEDAISRSVNSRDARGWSSFVRRESANLLSYYRHNGDRMDLSECGIMAAPCRPRYAHWEAITRFHMLRELADRMERSHYEEAADTPHAELARTEPIRDGHTGANNAEAQPAVGS